MNLTLALVSGIIGLVPGIVTAYVAMRFRMSEERAKWHRELALKHTLSRSDSPEAAARIAQQFGKGLLIVSEPGGEREKYFIPPGGRLFVGRGPDNDIILLNPAVSRRHAAFAAQDSGDVLIEHMHTAVPTKLNGKPLEESARLKSGDVVSIEGTRITYVEL